MVITFAVSVMLFLVWQGWAAGRNGLSDVYARPATAYPEDKSGAVDFRLAAKGGLLKVGMKCLVSAEILVNLSSRCCSPIQRNDSVGRNSVAVYSPFSELSDFH